MGPDPDGWDPNRWRSGESELIASLMPPTATAEDLQPLGNCGRDVYVFHNEYRVAVRPMLHPPMSACAIDGWGARLRNRSASDHERRQAVTERAWRQRRHRRVNVCARWPR